MLHKILLLPRALESFSYTVVNQPVFRPLFHCSHLSKALRAHSRSLRKLVINARAAKAGDFDADGGTLHSFKGFETLEHIDIPLYALFGVPPSIDNTRRYPFLATLLPPSLKTLKLRVGPEWSLITFAMASRLPHSWIASRVAFPMLREFVVYHSERAPPEGLQAQFTEAGIQLATH